MARNDKQARRIARKAKQAKRRQQLVDKPKWYIKQCDADDEFVELVTDALTAVDFSCKAQFMPVVVSWLRTHKRFGWDRVLDRLAKMNGTSDEKLATQMKVSGAVGEAVFGLIGKERLREFVPYNDVEFRPKGNGFEVVFRRLQKEKVDGQWVYPSGVGARIGYKDGTYTVAFSRHSIERLGERLCFTDPYDYDTAGYWFGQVHGRSGFEPCSLPDGTQAFTFFSECLGPLAYGWQYVVEVLGNNIEPDGTYHYRVGYCPVRVVGDYAMAKTLLCPGFAGTPEHALVENSDLSRERKKRMKADLDNLTASKLATTGDFALIRWFHENGVPQIRRFNHSLHRS